MPELSADNRSEAQLDRFLRQVQRRALVAASLSVPQQDALDCVQTSMLRFVRKYRHKEPDDWRPLFFRVLYNCLRDWHRHHAVKKAFFWSHLPPETLETAGPQPDRWLAAGNAGRALLSALSQLPLRQQQAFIMRHWEGLDTRTSASVLGVSEGTLKTHLSRAISSLRKTLKVHYETI